MSDEDTTKPIEDEDLDHGGRSARRLVLEVNAAEQRIADAKKKQAEERSQDETEMIARIWTLLAERNAVIEKAKMLDEVVEDASDNDVLSDKAGSGYRRIDDSIDSGVAQVNRLITEALELLEVFHLSREKAALEQAAEIGADGDDDPGA